MAYIDYIDYDDADRELKTVYNRYGVENRIPAAIIRISSVNPKALQGHLSLYRAINDKGSPLSAAQREMIAVAVSGINECHY
jgi:alkylhydroperoxidase family enzyme